MNNSCRNILGAAALALLFCAESALAVTLNNLYSETVQVSSQSAQARRSASARALATVLVRVSGTRDVLDAASVREALRHPEQYLEQFSYRRDSSGDGEGYALDVDFQAGGLRQLLNGAGLPVWSSQRPLLLAWIEYADGGRSGIVTRVSPEDWSARIDAEAQRRGLPVELPASVLGLNARDAARSRGADMILHGALNVDGAGCRSRWQLQRNGETARQWAFNADSKQRCVGLAMDEVAEYLSAQYAFAAGAGAGNVVMVQVAGIESFDNYADTILALDGLAVVEAVAVHSLADDRVRFALSLRGGVDQLLRAIELEQLLVESGPQPDTVAPPPLPDPAQQDSPVPVAAEPAGREPAAGGPEPVSAELPAAVPPPPAPPLYFRLRSAQF